MILIKKVKFKHYIFGISSQLIPLILIFKFIPLNYLQNFNFILLSFIIFFLHRYLHEYIHKYTGLLLGFDSELCFKFLNAYCKPKVFLDWKQVIIFSVAPMLVFTVIYSFLLFIFNMYDFIYGFYVVLINFIALFSTYPGDILYIYNANKYRGYIFEDTGRILKIYRK